MDRVHIFGVEFLRPVGDAGRSDWVVAVAGAAQSDSGGDSAPLETLAVVQIEEALPGYFRYFGAVVAAHVVHCHRHDGHVLLLRHHRDGVVLQIRFKKLLRVRIFFLSSQNCHTLVFFVETPRWKTSTSTAPTAAAPSVTTT